LALPVQPTDGFARAEAAAACVFKAQPDVQSAPSTGNLFLLQLLPAIVPVIESTLRAASTSAHLYVGAEVKQWHAAPAAGTMDRNQHWASEAHVKGSQGVKLLMQHQQHAN
jgi:hypothetical protein